MNGDKPVQLCVLCGEEPATKGDGDHLPPQCLYPRPRQPSMRLNKVPACVPCNNGGSKDDEQFKLVIGLSTGEFREDPQQVIDSLAGTIRNNMRLAKQVITKHKRGYGRRLGQSVVEPLVAIEFDREAYERVIKRIVRGLYWQQSSKILSRDTEISVIPVEPMPPELAVPIQQMLRVADHVELNGATFVYKFLLEGDGSSFWGIKFFDKHIVFAIVSSPQALPVE